MLRGSMYNTAHWLIGVIQYRTSGPHRICIWIMCFEDRNSRYRICTVKSAQEMKIAAVKAHSGVLHCGCGRTMLEIKREGIMFKQRDVLCRSRRHCWTDEVISFSCMICSPTDQENCIWGEEKDREKKKSQAFPFSPFDSVIIHSDL